MNDGAMINRNKLINQISEYLEPWVLSDAGQQTIDENTDLLRDLAIDSVGIMQLLLGIERDYKIVIPEYEIDNETFSRLRNFMDLIERKVNETC